MNQFKKIFLLAAVLVVALPAASAMAAPKSKFRFSQPTYVASEGQGTVAVTVTRTARHGHSKINQSSSVNWSITGGSATMGSDYSVSPDQGKLTFASGETTKTLTFTINQDTAIEGLETIALKLSAATDNALITNPRTAQVLIADDDGPTQVQLVPAAQTVNEAAGNATFYAVRSGDLTGTSKFDWATSDGTATQPGDYTQASGGSPAYDFNPGDFSKTINVTINDDSLVENPETFNVTLSNLTGATFANAATSQTATVTIVDNDSAPVFALDASSYDVNEDGSVDVTVQRLGNSAVATPVSSNDVFDVNWATTDGTATNPADYVPGPDQQLEFDASDDAETITIAADDTDTQIGLVDDSLVEGDETFNLALTSASNAGGAGADSLQPSLGTPKSATITIHDNDTPAGGGDNGAGSGNGGGNGGSTDTTGATGATGATGQDQGSQIVLGARQAACGLKVTASKKQKLLKQKGLKLKLRSGQRCKVTVTATIKALKSSKKKAQIVRSLSFKGKKSSLTLQPAKAKTVTVKFTKKTLAAIKKALQARKKLVATVVVSTRDSASKVSRKTLKITIRR